MRPGTWESNRQDSDGLFSKARGLLICVLGGGSILGYGIWKNFKKLTSSTRLRNSNRRAGMGRDRVERQRRGKRKPFVLLEKELLMHQNFRRLSAAGKVAFLYLKEKFNGSNGDDISLPYASMRDVLSRATLSRAFNELEAAGLIRFVRHGGLRVGGEKNCNIFALISWNDVKGLWG